MGAISIKMTKPEFRIKSPQYWCSTAAMTPPA